MYKQFHTFVKFGLTIQCNVSSVALFLKIRPENREHPHAPDFFCFLSLSILYGVCFYCYKILLNLLEHFAKAHTDSKIRNSATSFGKVLSSPGFMAIQ